jgi:hypothetical protein
VTEIPVDTQSLVAGTLMRPLPGCRFSELEPLPDGLDK